ncbi:MAG: SpoIIE family protein phosphatase [Spirochaetales bacterium]|nr:SpoIIE family protein phosphatase [Spirochaetales bacterium]
MTVTRHSPSWLLRMGDELDASFSALADGAFIVCSGDGEAILDGEGSLQRIPGAVLGERCVSRALPGVDHAAWQNLFAPQPEEYRVREDTIRCRVADGIIRVLRVRHAVMPGVPERRLVFIKDETEQHERRELLARAQSLEADESARLQAAVLVNGERVESACIEYACTTMPSKLVNGDFIDVFRPHPGAVDVMLGDVMGKGMDAAILGTVVKIGLFRSMATMTRDPERAPGVRDVCAATERFITPHLLARRSITTLSYLRLYEAEGLAEFVDFGHTPIVHYQAASGACRLVKGADMPLGFVEKQAFRSFLLPFRQGDIFVVFSDGLSECPGRERAYFGDERIMRVVGSRSDTAPRELADTLVRLAFEFSESGFADDVSLVCVKVNCLDADALEPGDSDGTLRLNLKHGSSSAGAKLRHSVDSALARAGYSDDEQRGRVVLACHEALVNILEHGLEGRGGRCVVDWRVRHGVFSAEYSYKGIDYDWLVAPEYKLGAYASHGYGVGIIHAAMDSVLVCKGYGDEKTLVLCKRLR